jgi:glycosyltransferase involved in cell wall biosynthesis
MKVCFVDQSTRLKTVDDLETKPRGGMVNSLFKVTDYLARQGIEVMVYSDIEEPDSTDSGVYWVNELPNLAYDVLVFNRGVGRGLPEVHAKHRILWTHDLPHAGWIPEAKTIKAFSKTVFMSNYAERIWRTFNPNIDKSVIIPNGVDKEIFYPRKKNLDHIIYFSHPNRGLKRLPLIFDAVKTRTRESIFLNAYSSGSMYPNEGDMSDHGDEFVIDYNESKVDGLNIKDPLPSHELAEQVGQAGLCIMPTGYPEICSNSILQALASGTPLVTTGGLGSAEEWVKKWNGYVTTFQPCDYMVHSAEIIKGATRILGNEQLHRQLIKNAAMTKIYNWNEIGEKWKKLLIQYS